MLIIAPLTVEIYKILEFDFRPTLIVEAITANFASISSLVGSIPNIVISEYSEATFIEFVLVMGPLSIILLITAIPVYYVFARETFVDPPKILVEEIFLLDPNILVEDRRTFYAVIIGLIILVLGFIFGNAIHLEAAEIALLIAAVFRSGFSAPVPELGK